MKILFASNAGLWPLCDGGAEVAIHELLTILSKKYKCECHAIGSINNNHIKIILQIVKILNYSNKSYNLFTKFYLPSFFKNFFLFFPISIIRRRLFYGISFSEKYSIFYVNENRLLTEIESQINRIKPDIIFTQTIKSEEICKLANKFQIPAIVFLVDCTNFTINIIYSLKNYKNINFVYNSEFLKNKLNHLIEGGRNTIVLHPIIIKKNYLVKKENNNFVTYINPIKEKGVYIFREIVSSMPQVDFLLVQGWPIVNFNQIKNNFQQFKNVSFMEKQTDMKKIYSRTKILLVPSTCEEAFGRIVVEAGLNGIPTIASKVGNLKQTIGKGGILIKEYYKIKIWTKSIKFLLENEKKYSYYSKMAVVNSLKFTDLSECKKILTFSKRLIIRH